ncbi:2-keto-4-pentenoate hydratase/2-oxohepta-3-ene-1,7-dioic acid hydratase (catechol pathway) [Jannaschia faecimaris]|uniref:2-keto-4-pentenoate hydratase/2-oxohepta-3-ene-1,7-dioic acid hydratase (Catechol pathway) n=1 Tax=Jannaschia faecimaris TaxID=1244108 RepID=A0A1H3SSE2_9RHOB|nr:fumarylacetoacetate hydrolase family protein [Jannaschia faecimaris]SDZ40617.1 2-keto-4-pentenoate hydratase/2-oxohepta-3-ene-1,7-dioic acid hydratase (catechol pathway) [Jannaschia faecimaris]
MKLVTFEIGGKVCAGFLDGDAVVTCASGPDAGNAVRDLVSGASGSLADWKAKADARHPVSDVQLLAPIPEPRRDIFCVGKNYRAHAAEFHSSGFDTTAKAAVPSDPVVFTKATTTVVGPDAEVRGSLDTTGTVDYEGELGVVIGTRAFQVSRDAAMDCIFGYVIINDVTSRELQQKHNQWVIGKGIDTFCPMGPWLVTADEAGDPRAMQLETTINTEVRQKASVADLIFDIPTLISTISQTMTLLPGDIIATGTPEGVGIGFKPPRYLIAGDIMEVSISGLGRLTNRIV